MAGIITLTALFVMIIILLLPSLTQAWADQFELVFITDGQTVTTGSILLQCRYLATAEPLEVNQTKFWRNRSSACDPDLSARTDVQVFSVDNYWIKFNHTRHLDGIYTCGRVVIQENNVVVKESTPWTLICKFSKIMHAK